MLLSLVLAAQVWVIKELIPPEPRMPGTELGFGQVIAVGDLNGDAAVESYMQAAHWPLSEQFLAFMRGWPMQERAVYSVPTLRIGTGAANGPRIALLQSPSGLVVAFLDFQNGGLLHTRRFPEVSQLVNNSSTLRPGTFVRFPDVNGDGWEELFCQDYSSSEGYPMMVDGRTLTTLWRNVLPDSEYPYMLTRNTATDPQDIDGDLIADPIAVWTTYYPQTGGWDHSIQAFSGATGAQLWENRANTSRGLTVPSVGEHDLTGDSINDVVLANGFVIKLVSGADGATVWSFDPGPILQAAGPVGWTYNFPRTPAVLTRMPSSAVLQLVLPILYLRLQPFSEYRIEFAHFDPHTGTFLGFATLPADVQPWFPDVFQNTRGDSLICALGDVDRDGLQEISFGVPAPAYDVVLDGHMPKYFVTLGLKTLEIPAQLRLGVAATASVSIPSAPLHDFYLIGSRSFDRRGGVRLEGWRTHLVDDPWLTWSTVSRSFRGSLDASGVGQTLVAVPNHPALAGTTLYTRAVVLAPGGQEIWTISTLGISEIVP